VRLEVYNYNGKANDDHSIKGKLEHTTEKGEMCHRGLAMVRALTVMLTDGHEEGGGRRLTPTKLDVVSGLS
jgi:hypothetical protein